MARDGHGDSAAGDVRVPFLFVPQGETPPPEWLADHPGWVKIPATFVPRGSGDDRAGGTAGPAGDDAPWPTGSNGRPWPRDRFGHPYRPLTDHGAGERAPGEGLLDTGPSVPDLDIAVASYRLADGAIRQVTAQGTATIPPTGSSASGADVPETAKSALPLVGAADGGTPTTPPGAAPPSVSAATKNDPTAPVPLVDDQGRLVLRTDGTPIMRPAGLDPHMFVAEGLKDKERLRVALQFRGDEEAVAAALFREIIDTWKFDRWHSWDAQRVGGKYHPEFVDYATIAIGLYAAAAGISRDRTLSIEDFRARTSTFRPEIAKDKTYSHLPEINVRNTDIGYELFRAGRIGTELPGAGP